MSKILYLLAAFFLFLYAPQPAGAQSVTPIIGLGSVCLGSTLSLTDSTFGGKWSSSDTAIASIDSALGIVTGKAAGSVIISYSIDTSFAITAVVVDTIEPAGFITGPDSVCLYGSITLISSANNGIWVTSNGLAKDSMGIVTGLSGGIDTVMYVVTNACGSDTASLPVTVKTIIYVTGIIGPSSVCLDVPVPFSEAASGGNWRTTNANASISSSGILLPQVLGKDTIMYTSANSCGVDTATKAVSILTTPRAPLILGPSVLCVGQTIHLSDTVKGTWSSSNASVTLSGSADIYGVSAGMDTVSFKVSNACGIDTAIQILTIDPLPLVPPITRTKNLLSVPSGYSSYQWTMNGNDISGATGNTYDVTNLQNYFVIVGNDYGCTVASPSQTVTQLECDPTDLKVYPNPATTTLNINWCEKVTAMVSTLDGRIVRVVKNTNQVDISLLPNNSYMLKVFDSDGHELQTRQFKKVAK